LCASAALIIFYALLKVHKICTLKNPNTSNAEPPPGVSRAPAQPCSAERSHALFGGGEALLAFAAVLLSSCLCAAAAAALLSSHPARASISSRLQNYFIRCALNYPSSWISVQGVLPEAGSTSYKDKLAVLVLVGLIGSMIKT